MHKTNLDISTSGVLISVSGEGNVHTEMISIRWTQQFLPRVRQNVSLGAKKGKAIFGTLIGIYVALVYHLVQKTPERSLARFFFV